MKRPILGVTLAFLLALACFMPQTVLAANTSTATTPPVSSLKAAATAVQPPTSSPTNLTLSDTVIPSGGSITLSWTKVVDASIYRVRLNRQNPDGSWTSIRFGGSTDLDYGDVSSITLSGLTWTGAYKFTVYAGNAAGWHTPGEYSEAYYVAGTSLTNVQVTPTLIPTGGSATFSWSKVYGATMYRIRLYRQSPNGSWTNINYGGGQYRDYGDISSMTYGGLTWTGTYKALIYYGDASGWHTPGTYTNLYRVAVPALTNVKASPASIRPGQTVTISWSRAAGATRYRTRLYRQNANGSWTNISYGGSLYRDYSDITSTSYPLTWLGTYKALVYFGDATGWHTPGTYTNTFSVNTVTINIDFRTEFIHGNKPAQYQKYIVLHDTEGTGNPKSVINSWDASNNGVAAHFVVGTDGSIFQCVAMDKIAHHAGFGDAGNNIRYGVTDEYRDDKRGTVPIGSAYPDYGMNSYSIGIELVHVNGGSPYTKAQLDALDGLIAYIDAFYGSRSKIIRHKDWRSSNPDTSQAFDTYFSNYQKYRSYKAP